MILSCVVILAATLVFAEAIAFSPSSAFNSSSSSQPTFGTPVNLSNDNYNASYPWVANVGSHVYVAWTEERHGIFFRMSPDNGTTWDPPLDQSGMRISSSVGTTDYPIIAANQSDVYVTWSQTANVSGAKVLEIFFAGSTNYGAWFSPAQQLTSGYSSNGYITPVIATSGQYVYLAYTAGGKNSYVIANNNFGAAGSWTNPFHFSITHEPQVAAWGENGYAVADGVAVAVTNDGGASWTDSMNVTNRGDEPWIAASGSYVYVVSQTKTVNGSIHAMISNDYGNNWDPVQTLSNGVNDAWEPQMVASGNYVYVAFHSVTAPIANWMVVSANNGKTWSSPLEISSSTPMPGWATQIATTGCGGGYSCSSTPSNYVFTQWPVLQHSQNTWQMYSSISTDNGATWTSPPGVDVSGSNINFSSSGPNDIATSSIAAFANHAFLAWTMCQQCGINHNITLNHSQVIFDVSDPLPSSTTTTTTTVTIPTTSTQTITQTSTDSTGTTTCGAFITTTSTSTALSTVRPTVTDVLQPLTTLTATATTTSTSIINSTATTTTTTTSTSVIPTCTSTALATTTSTIVDATTKMVSTSDSSFSSSSSLSSSRTSSSSSTPTLLPPPPSSGSSPPVTINIDSVLVASAVAVVIVIGGTIFLARRH